MGGRCSGLVTGQRWGLENQSATVSRFHQRIRSLNAKPGSPTVRKAAELTLRDYCRRTFK